MSVQFFSKLSQNYIELLKDDEYYDITIEVGEDPNVKIFRAHMNILCYRSPYLRRILASNKNRNKENILSHIKLSNLSPENFQIILEYIYGGIFSLNGQESLDIMNILVAADVLHLQELVDYLQIYLIKNNPEWIEQHFWFTQQITSHSNNLLELQEFCTRLMAKSPEKILKSLDFTSLSEKSLISLIKRDDLQMREVEVWECVLKWGHAQNPTLISEPGIWSDNDFKIMKNILQNCLPLVRFFSLSSKEFSRKVRPYQKLLNNQLYENLLSYYLDPEIVSTHKILRPRKTVLLDNDLNIASTILRWIDKIDINGDNFREFYLPYKFELLLRGSRDGFTPKKFHELCDNKDNTITLIKVKGTEEILGGYNPLEWKSSDSWGITKESFIFSFKNKNIKDAIISNVKNINRALNYDPSRGPQFGVDIVCGTSNRSTSQNYNHIYCKKNFYEKAIRNSSGNFFIEDYEIFQITKLGVS